MPAHPVTIPTDLQRRSYEAVKRHGTQAAAAKALGQYQGTIRGAVLRYCQITGAPLPEGMSQGKQRPSASGTLRAIPERLDRIEGRLDTLADIEQELAALRALVESFVHRQPVILGTASHRRVADGGQGGRRENRDTQRKLARVVGA